MHILTTLDSSFSASNTCTRTVISETTLPLASEHQVRAYSVITLEQQGHKSNKPMPATVHSTKPSPLSLCLLHCRALRQCLYTSILPRICASVKSVFGGMFDCCSCAAAAAVCTSLSANGKGIPSSWVGRPGRRRTRHASRHDNPSVSQLYQPGGAGFFWLTWPPAGGPTLGR